MQPIYCRKITVNNTANQCCSCERKSEISLSPQATPLTKTCNFYGLLSLEDVLIKEKVKSVHKMGKICLLFDIQQD
jgi:hypothetical protein